MVVTDIFFNFVSNLNNNILIRNSTIKQIKSKKIIFLLNILFKKGFIKSYKVNSNDKLEIFLKYKNNKNIIKNIKILSKPGKRLYIKNKELKKKSGFYIVSTIYGFITEKEAIEKGVGGELICQICLN